MPKKKAFRERIDHSNNNMTRNVEALEKKCVDAYSIYPYEKVKNLRGFNKMRQDVEDRKPKRPVKWPMFGAKNTVDEKLIQKSSTILTHNGIHVNN